MPNQETLNRYFEKLEKDLINKDYNKLLIHLRLLGRSFENWKTPHSANNLLKDPNFRASLTRNEQTALTDEAILVHQEKLTCLRKVLLAWDDTSLLREGESLEGENLKKQRQAIKFKSTLDKYDRRAVHLGLNTLVLHLTANETEATLNLNSTYDLIELVSKLIKDTNLADEKLERHELGKIGLAIKSFQTPNKKKKWVKYSSLFFAFIAALACGLSTGAAIILLFPSLSILAVTLGGLIAAFGFIANFSFLSQNFPDFMLGLFKKGLMSEYIDLKGERKQFSRTYNSLLIPLALASFTVGAGTTALTYLFILKLVTHLLPVLAVIWPPLPVLIVSILAVSVGITLTIAVFTGSLESLKKVAALNMSFKELCQSAYRNCLEWFRNLRNLKTHQIIGLIIMVLLIPIGLAGLAYYRYTAGVDLSVFIGVAGSIAMGIVAYIAQMAFTCLSINKLKNALIKPFSSTQQVVDDQDSKSFIKSVLSNIWYVLSLFVNAIGNAVLVYDGSSVSVAGAASCGLISFTGNMSEPDMNHYHRKAATAELVNQLKLFNIRPATHNQKDEFASSSDSDKLKLKDTINRGFPPEPSKPIIINMDSAPTTPTEEPYSSPSRLETPRERTNSFGPDFFKRAAAPRPSSPQENTLVATVAKH